MLAVCVCFFIYKQKTAYEMRISDWSSDVCSSDLRHLLLSRRQHALWRGQGFRAGPRGRPFRDGGYERDTESGDKAHLITPSRKREGNDRHKTAAKPSPNGLRFESQRVKIGRASCRERAWQYV